jgi:Leucine-rich repeat (LRR) protein
MSDFNGYATISVLNLSSNGVSDIDEDSFRGLINVTHIYLSENNISYIPPRTFNQNAFLKKLYLKNNPLTLPENESILQSDSITYLDIAFCNITLLPVDTFASLPNLVAIRLDGNVLTNITTETFEPLRNLEEIYMESKTVKCAEKFYKEFLNYLEKRAIKYYGPSICCEECLSTRPFAVKLTIPILNPAVCNGTRLVLTSATTRTISSTEASIPSLNGTTFTPNDAHLTANTSSSVTYNPDLHNTTDITEDDEELSSKSLSGNHSPSRMMTAINVLSTCLGLLRVLQIQ